MLGAQMHMHVNRAKASLPEGLSDRLVVDGHATLVSLGDVGTCLRTNGGVDEAIDVAIHVGNLRVHSSAGVPDSNLYRVGNEIVAEILGDNAEGLVCGEPVDLFNKTTAHPTRDTGLADRDRS